MCNNGSELHLREKGIARGAEPGSRNGVMLVSRLGVLTEAENFESEVLTGRNSCVYSATSLPTSTSRRGDGKEDAAEERQA